MIKLIYILHTHTQFQHDQVDQFCSEHTVPLKKGELNTLLGHLLYDDTHKIVFCYVPKNGCTNMKRLMLVLNGILPPETSNMSVISNKSEPGNG